MLSRSNVILLWFGFFGGSFNSPYTYRRIGESKSEVVGRLFGKTSKTSEDFKKYEIIGNIHENPELIKTELQ